MPIRFTETADGKVVEVELSGKLHRQDFERFAPELDRLFRRGVKVNVITIMRDFHGWDALGFWEDFKWQLKHYQDLHRIALVGNQRWQSMMARICQPFTSAEVRYFDIQDIEGARDWIGHVEEAVA